ncbi:MAG: membrane protein insertion efficiency factor YidD [Leptospira sp.]|nr:membrane protein insertion efficiency factor YidD [Leptospira sp.]
MNRFFVFFIRIYQKFLSPLLPGACRFSPTCSEYSVQAFQNYNFFKAMYLSANRFARCNPFFEGYNDPLPVKQKKGTN